MRFNAFRKNLLESEQDEILSINDKVKDLAQRDPKALDYAIDAIKKARQYAQKIIANAKRSPAPKPEVGEAAEGTAGKLSILSQEIDAMEKEIAEICQLLGEKCEGAVVNLKKFLSGLYGKMEDLVSSGKQEGAEEERQEFKKWYNGLGAKLLKLGQKAISHVEVTAEELKALSSTERSKVKSSQINANKFAEELGNSLETLFLKVLFTDAGKDYNITIKDVDTFLDEAYKGTVINNQELVARDSGLIDDFVNKRSRKVYDAIAGPVVKLKPPASGGANIGPGELALAMLGNPAAKADKGDIQVGDDMYEVKAGAGSVGGRFNSDKVTTALNGWKVWDRGLEEIAGQGVILRDKNAKGKDRSLYNFNNTGIEKVNSEILKKYSDPEKTKKWLTKTFERLVTNHSELPNMESYIDSMIVKSDDPELNGTIDEKTYMNLYARLLYDSYSKADGVTNIIIIDTKSRTYRIIRDSEDLGAKLGQKGGVRTSGGFNWNDNHQKASPQFVTN
tara:strand:+ start:5244 stop:6761 length:1518 start_codon:yes stop_codon:yes gene_type:complete